LKEYIVDFGYTVYAIVLVFALSVLRFTASDYTCGIF